MQNTKRNKVSDREINHQLNRGTHRRGRTPLGLLREDESVEGRMPPTQHTNSTADGSPGTAAPSPTHWGCKATEISLLPVLEARDPSQGVSRATLPPRLSRKPLPSLPALWGSSAHQDSSPSPLCLHLAYFPRLDYLQISQQMSPKPESSL